MNWGTQTSLGFSFLTAMRRKHNWSSRYLSNKHTVGYKLPVICLIGICLSVEDCLWNIVLCVCAEVEKQRTKSEADEWEIITVAERRVMSSTGCLCTANGIQVKMRNFMWWFQGAINYLWDCDLFHSAGEKKKGAEFELIFPKDQGWKK